MDPLLKVSDLRTSFTTENGIVQAVDGISFELNPGEILGLVGESGCGKSVASLSILRLIDPPGRITGGEVIFHQQDLMKITEEEMAKIRGSQISMIFQQPQSCLDPVYPIGDQIAEVFQIHRRMGKKEAMLNAINLLRQVGIPDAESKAVRYPHEMSGGQAQRVMIAMALALHPRLLIADEPTTALDVTIQAQILDLLRGLRDQFGTAIILITHDLGVVAETADRVAVMYAGRLVEQAPVERIFAQPAHPYTRGLISSLPVPGQVKKRLEAIPGNVPNLIGLPPGCKFAPRCLERVKAGLRICEETEPPLSEVEPGHVSRCWLVSQSPDHLPADSVPEHTNQGEPL